MEIRVYDREMNFKGIVDNATSLIWIRRYYEVGEFELHAPLTDRNLELLKADNLVTIRGAKEAGIIEDILN
ncbi:MAG TPA: siphovirus ReqiPepy6 Gp37-like family protein, partial [Candidatus Blautia ornithocaccae]|nr:siphovirus ReqiPepy6 Gp37-like family protein [Candidatus Blautia ornithocaccae]